MSGSLPANYVAANGVGAILDGNLNAAVQVVQNYAALRNFVALSNMAVAVLGGTSPGDGNGGIFYWANGSYTDDGQNTIVPNGITSGAWLRDPVFQAILTATTLTVTGDASIGTTIAAPVLSLGNNTATSTFLKLIGPAGTLRQLEFLTGASLRWQAGEDTTAEGGGNTGTNFVITRYDDTGTLIDTPITINRSTGAVSFTDNLVPSQTNGIVGTTTNNNANAGSVGEFISANLASPVSLASGTSKDITTISLTAGDWQVWGTVQTNISGGTATAVTSWINTSSITAPTVSNGGAITGSIGVAVTFATQPTGQQRLSLSGTTTVYLSTQVSFTGTAASTGFIGARRVR